MTTASSLCTLALRVSTYGEVAERVDASRDAVKKRWQRLRARLDALGLPDCLVD